MGFLYNDTVEKVIEPQSRRDKKRGSQRIIFKVFSAFSVLSAVNKNMNRRVAERNIKFVPINRDRCRRHRREIKSLYLSLCSLCLCGKVFQRSHNNLTNFEFLEARNEQT